MNCLKCGNKGSSDTPFCTYCGNPMNSAGQQYQLKQTTTASASVSASQMIQQGPSLSPASEKILGVIIYAARHPDYSICQVFLTETQVIGIETSVLSKIVSATGAAGQMGMWITAGLNPAAGFGLTGLVGMKVWGNLKKSARGQLMVSKETGHHLTLELLNGAKFKLPYIKVKDVSIKKVIMSSDYMIKFSAGFLATENIFIDGSATEDVRSLLKSTPLAGKLKE